MAYDRYDPRNERSRWRDDERGERNWRSDRSQSGREDRGFFERAGDEIASWFGDDDSGRRRERDDREGGRFLGRDDNARNRSWGDNSWDRGNFDRDDRSSSTPSGWGSRSRETGRDVGSTRDRENYRPVTGDYGRSEQFFGASGTRGGQDRWSSDRSSNRPNFDPQYSSWRDRQISELDRDYDEYRRENQSRFEDEFTGWRQQRQTKRSLLGQIREHMEVLGNDNEHVGTVDRVAGDRIILTKSDPESGGHHHSLMCTDVDSIDSDKVMLGCSAEDAKKRWRDESRERALFEREDQGEAGPHMLDRSFEGTYRR